MALPLDVNGRRAAAIERLALEPRENGKISSPAIWVPQIYCCEHILWLYESPKREVTGARLASTGVVMVQRQPAHQIGPE